MRVLLVSADSDCASAVRESAEEAGVVLDLAQGLPEAADLAGGSDYHAIVVDAGGAPDRATQALRRRFPRIRILVADAWRSATDRARALDAGADETVDKPIVAAELAARLRAMLRRGLGPAPSSDTLVCGDLVVDLRLHEVRRGGQLLHPTAHEYELIRFLAAHPGRVVSREEIGARVIEPNFVVSSNAVDVLMCHVRAKLGEPDLIQTVRGYGYALAPPGTDLRRRPP
jgi:two-component system OmpR family response regulator